jgi:hypothetical protein
MPAYFLMINLRSSQSSKQVYLSRNGEHPIWVGGESAARATHKNGESALILQALCACKISALNEDWTTGMLPRTVRSVILGKETCPNPVA